MKISLLFAMVAITILPASGQSSGHQNTDPNNHSMCCATMTVLPRRDGNVNYTLPDEVLEYTIYFQNKTSSYIQNLVIRDTINELLNINSFRPLKASHNLNTLINIPKSFVEFKFENINLPPKDVDETLSQGFVTFIIKPNEGLPEETIVVNKAYIFFDGQPAGCTNETINTIVSQLPPVTSLRNKQLVGVSILPAQNPFVDELSFYITLETPKTLQLQLFDASGKQLFTNLSYFHAGKTVFSVPPSSLNSQGTYFLRAMDETGYLTVQIMQFDH